MINRRQWLYGAGAIAAAGTRFSSSAIGTPEDKAKPVSLEVSQYEPKSMLQVHESRIERGKFPVIDFHTHISLSTKSEKGVELSPDRQYLGTPQELLAVMARKNIKTMVNLTGGYEKGLAEAVAKYDRVYPGRFYTFTEPSYSRFKEPDYPNLQAQAIQQAHRDGARGLKIRRVEQPSRLVLLWRRFSQQCGTDRSPQPHDGTASQDAVRDAPFREFLRKLAERCRESGPLSQHVGGYGGTDR